MRVRTFLKQQFRRLGLEVNRFNAVGSFTARRQLLLTRANVDLVLDVGASDGGFALELRAAGYRGRIVSFEPLETPFRSLLAKAEQDMNWEAFSYGLGKKGGQATMNVARDDKCSSFLDPLKRQTKVYSGAEISSSVTVEMQCLRDLYGKTFNAGDQTFLKIDAQGYEGQVLEGAGDILRDMKI